MKKIVLIIVSAWLITGGIVAQTIDDALRYSQIFYSGTARFNAMGGAFTALGADMSTLSQNPAGIGMYRASEFSITPRLSYIKSDTYFDGYGSTDYEYNFKLGQVGYVANIFKSQSASNSFVFNIGYSYNMTNNFKQHILTSGINNSSSIADSWAAYGDGCHYTELGGPEGIAYDTWVIDTLTGYGGSYYGTVYSNYGDDLPSVYGQRMKRSAINDGFMGEHSFSLGGNYSDKLYFGMTFGFNKLKFSSYSEHIETADMQLVSGFKSLNYVDYYENDGDGFTFKLGVIAKPIDILRIGVAFHSPTFYNIDEYFYQDITSKFDGSDSYSSNTEPMRFNYALRTPSRFLTGVAVQIQKVALVSVDYEYVNYANALFSQTGDGYNYSDKNNEIKDAFKSASNFKIGGEYRISNLYLRGGYGYYGKPFKSRETNADLDYMTLSCGVGLRTKNVSFDFGYVNYRSKQYYYLYHLDSYGGPPSPGYDLETMKNTFTFTLGFRFNTL